MRSHTVVAGASIRSVVERWLIDSPEILVRAR
jgi:hypothetical protein